MDAAENLGQSASESLQAGDQLGRYQLLCPIARGGMGQVWAARQAGRLGLPKLVAIKVAIPLESSSYRQVQEYLFDEAQVAASVDHPNVCKILELGHEREILFIAMEWLHGAPLSTLVSKLPNRRLDYRIAAHLVAEACSGLHAAHEVTDEDGVHLEVVHRDATPHNLLITAAGEVKVMDFGIVKSKNQHHQATQTGELKGKIAYLAPELIHGKEVDRRTDIFTLGCVLYGITVGTSPFNPNGQDAGQTILRILEGKYAAPSTVVPDYPAKLEAIVTRALATDVRDRFQSAEEMRVAIEDFLSDSSRPVSREEVAALLHRYCGSAIELRRAEIRAAQKLFDSQSGQVRSGTFPAGQTHDSPTPLVPPSGSLAPASSARPGPEPVSADRTLASESAPVSRPHLPEKRSVHAALLGGGIVLALALTALASYWVFSPAPAPQAQTGAAPHAPALAAPAQTTAAEPPAPLPAQSERSEPAAPAAERPAASSTGARPSAAHRPVVTRPSVKPPESPAGTPQTVNTAAERARAEPSNDFAQPMRKPPVHSIDESDPFAK